MGDQPLKDRHAGRGQLVKQLNHAREKKADSALLSKAELLCESVSSEVAVMEVIVSTKDLKGHGNLDKTAVNSDLTRLREQITESKAALAMPSLIAEAEQLLRRLQAEQALSLALEVPVHKEEEGVASWSHANGQVFDNALDSFKLRVDMLESAINTATAEEVAPTIIELASQ